MLDGGRRSACLCGRALYSLKSHIEVLLQRVRNSSHPTDLSLSRPSSRVRGSRQHQLHDPLWRGGAFQHALAQASGRLHTHRIAGRKRAESSKEIFSKRRRSNWLPRRELVAFVSALVLVVVLLLASVGAPRLLFFLFLFLRVLLPCLGRFSLSGSTKAAKGLVGIEAAGSESGRRGVRRAFPRFRLDHDPDRGIVVQLAHGGHRI